MTGLIVAVLVGIPGGNARREQSLTDPTRTRARFRGSTDYSMVITEPHATAGEAARLARAASFADRYAPPGEPGASAAEGGDPNPHGTWVRVTTWGKPFASLWGYSTDGRAGQQTGGDWLGLIAPHARAGSRVFPYWPLWWGFLGNTAAYAAAWWGVITLARAEQRWRRKRRGACAWCGYDRRGGLPGACPECGKGSDADKKQSRRAAEQG